MSADLGINLKAEGLAQFEADMKRAVQVTLAGAQLLKSGLAGVDTAIRAAFTTGAVIDFEAELRKAGGVAAQQAGNIGASVSGIDDAIDKAFDPNPLQKLQSEMKETAAVSTSAGSKISSSFKNMFAAAGLALGVREVFQGIKALGQEAIGGAISYESLNTQFEVFLGNADLAKTTLAELTKFSDVTPYEPDEVNASAKALLGLGVAQADLIPALTVVGDIAAGVGANFQDLAVAYGKAMGAGLVQNDILNQFQDRGINVLRELGKMYGANALQVKKMAEQNLISSEDFKKALENMSGEGGKFNGMMDKMSQSTEGLLSTLRGNIKNALRSVGEAILPTVKAMVQWLIKIPEFIKSHQDIVKAIKAMVIAAASIGGAMLLARGAVLAYNGIVAAGPAIMAAYRAAVDTLKAAQIAYSMATNTAAGAMKAFQVIVASNPWGIALTAIAAIGTAVYFLSSKTEELTAKQKVQNEVSRQIAEEYGKQAAGSEALFAKLKTLDKGSNEYKETIGKINTQYKEYLPYLLTNKSTVEQIKEAQDKLNESLLESIRLKIKEQTLTQLAGDYLTRAQSQAIGLSKQTGLTVKQIQSTAEELGMLAKADVWNGLSEKIEKWRASIGPQGWWDQAGEWLVKNNPLRAALAARGLDLTAEQQLEKARQSQIADLNKAPDAFIDSLRSIKGLSAEAKANLDKLAKSTTEVKLNFLEAANSNRQFRKDFEEANAFFEDSGGIVTGKDKNGGLTDDQIKEMEARRKRIEKRRKELALQEWLILHEYQRLYKDEDGFDMVNPYFDKWLEKVKENTDKGLAKQAAILDKQMKAMLVKDATQLPTLTADDLAEGFAMEKREEARQRELQLLREHTAKTKELFEQTKQAVIQSMAQMAGDMAFAIGEALTSGGSPADILRKTLREMAVQIPRMTGMALLNAAANPAYAYISLPLAVAGLALLGASGLISGVFKAQDKKREAKVANAAAQSAMPNGQNAPAGLAAYSSGQSIGDQVSDALQNSTWVINIGGQNFDAAVERSVRNNKIRRGQ